MAYDTKTVKRDGSGITPVPQHFNPIADDYEPIYGRNNAGRVELYGPDGNPITTSSGKLAVRASEVESLLNDIKGKDFATQTTLAAIMAKIITTPSTEAKQDALNALIGEVQASPTANTLLARLKSLEDKIAAIDSVLDAIVDGSAPAVTQLSGSNVPDAEPIPVKHVASTIAQPVDLQYRKILVETSSDYGGAMNVAVSGNHCVTITPPAGEIWRIRMLRVKIPLIAGATGNHTMYIRQGVNLLNGSIMSCVATGVTDINLLYNYFQTGTIKPSTEAGQIEAIRGLVISPTCPLYIAYNNGTDSVQEGTSIIMLVREVEYFG